MIAALFDSVILVDALVGLSSARTEIVRAPDRWITRQGWAEVLAGARGDGERVGEFLDHFRIIELDAQIARRGAALCEQWPHMALGSAMLLAAAQVTGRILITRNTKDFPAAMPGIRIPYSL